MLTPGSPNTLWPPILGQKCIRWVDVFALIQQPKFLYDVYKPLAPSFDQMTMASIWECWDSGEAVHDKNGDISGMKPPIRQIEQQFGSGWRKGSKVCFFSKLAPC